MSLILIQETASTIPTPAAGRGTLFLNETDQLVVKNPAGNVSTVFALTPTGNTSVIYNNAGEVGLSGNMTFDNTTNTFAVTNANVSNLTVTGTLIAGDIAVSSIANGTSNVDIVGVSGNVTVSVAGNANVLSVTATGIIVSGTANVGNLSTELILASNSISTTQQLISNVSTGTAPLVIKSTTQVANLNVATAGLATFATTANAVAGANVTGTVANATFATSAGSANSVAVANVSGIGNIATVNLTGSNSNVLYGNGVFANAPVTYSNSNVATFLASYGSNTISTTGNVTAGNIIGNGQSLTGIAGANVTGTVANATFATSAGSADSVAGANVSGTVANATFATSAGSADSVAGANVTGNVANALNAYAVAGANVSGTVANATFATSAGSADSVAGANVTGNVSNALNAYAVAGANVTGNVSNALNAYAVAGANVSGTVANATFATSAGSADSVAGANVSGTVANATFATSAGSVAGANVSGQVANSLVAGTVYTNAQPNITSVGTLTGLSVDGSNISLANGVYVGNGSGLTALAGANVTGQVGNALVAGTVYTNAQPNITSVGTLTSLNVSGNANVGNIGAAAGVFTTVAGNLTTAAQPNITSVGTLTSLAVTGNVDAGNVVTNAITGATTGVTITAIGTNQNINLTPTGTGTVNVGNFIISNVAIPLASTDAATKQYVDDVAQGLHTHDSCNAATQTTLASISGGTVTYDNGTSGVGATLTTTGAYTTIDGVTLSNGMRILVKDEVTTANNGIYVRTSATVLTRADDFDTPTEMAGGDFTFVTAGTLYDNTGWVMVDVVTTVGTSPVVWVQFSGAGSYTAGTGLTLNGSQFSITNTTVTAGSYGNGDSVASFTVNGQGQLSAAANVAITANAANLTGTTLASGITTSSLTTVGTLGSLSVTGNISAGNVSATTFTGALSGAATTAGTVTTNAQPNITSTGTLTSLAVTGNISAGNVSATTFTGALSGAATTAGTVTTNAQPNITSIGTLTSLDVSGTITAANITANTGVFTGNGNGLSSLVGANVSGAVSYATTANAVAGANVSGTVANATFATSAGSADSVAGANVSGAVSYATTANAVAGANVSGTVANATFATSAGSADSVAGANVSGQVANALVAGTVYTNAQPNITSVGTLTSLSVSGNITGGNISTSSVTAANIILPNSSILTFGDTPVTNRYYIDATRTDTYTQNGSQARPFKTIAGAQAAIATAIIGGLNPEVEPIYMILLSNITEDVTLATNHVYLIGQNGQIHQPIILSGNVTVNPTSGTLNNNHFSISGLEIVGGTNGKAIYVTGTYPTRLSLQDVWITANGTGAGLYQDNTGTGTYTHGGPIKVSHNGSGDVYCFDIRKGTASFDTVETSGATQVGAAGPGATLTFNNSQLDANGDVVVETYGSGVLVVTNSVIKNSQANGFGVKLNAVANVAGTVSIGQSAFNVPTGTGSAVWLDPNTTAGLSGVFAWSGTSFYPSTNTTISPTLIPGPLAILVGTQVSPIFYGDITSYALAQDWDLIDNNSSALSFDTTGKAGIINIVTTNSSEGVTMSGYANVTGNVTGGNIITGGIITATGNVTGGNLITGGIVSATGNITGGNISGTLLTGTLTTAAQPNITSVSTLTSLDVSGTITAANITANTGVFTGNGNGLSSLVGANVTGNVSNALNAYAVAVANVSGIGNIATVNLDGNLSNILYGNGVFASAPAGGSYGNSNVATFLASYGSNTISTTGNVTAGNIIGNGQALSGIAGANVTGTVANATYATSAGSANSVAVANVSGIGNIATVNLDGNLSNILYGNGVFAPSAGGGSYGNSNVATFLASYGSNTISTTGNITAGNIIGNGQALTDVAGANISGQVANALIAGTVYTNAQPNITSIGTLTSLDVTGNISAGNVNAGNLLTANYSTAVLTTAAQPNITSVGTLTSLAVTGNTTSGNFIGRLANGNSNVNIATANGNVTIASVGNTTLTITGTGANISGYATVTGNISATSYSGNGSALTGVIATIRTVTVADATSVTMNTDTSDIVVQTNTQVAGTLTINAVTGTPINGQKIILRLQSANVQTFAWNAVFTGSTDTPLPTASSGSSKYDYLGFIYNSIATKWQMMAKNFGF